MKIERNEFTSADFAREEALSEQDKQSQEGNGFAAMKEQMERLIKESRPKLPELIEHEWKERELRERCLRLAVMHNGAPNDPIELAELYYNWITQTKQ